MYRLTHARNANEQDARIAISATHAIIEMFLQALVRVQRGMPERCPVCTSYRLQLVRSEDGDSWVKLCEACGSAAAADAPPVDTRSPERDQEREPPEGDCVEVEDFGIYLTRARRGPSSRMHETERTLEAKMIPVMWNTNRSGPTHSSISCFRMVDRSRRELRLRMGISSTYIDSYSRRSSTRHCLGLNLFINAARQVVLMRSMRSNSPCRMNITGRLGLSSKWSFMHPSWNFKLVLSGLGFSGSL